MSLRQPVVIDVPFHEDDIKIEQSIDQVPCEVDGSELSSGARRLLKTYPTVYIIRAKQRQLDCAANQGALFRRHHVSNRAG